MRSLARGRGRVARGLALSAACLLVPATAHIVAGGGVPATGPFLFAAALLSAACVALADRRLTPAEIAALLFASQPVLHVLLAMSAHGHGAGTSTIGLGMVAAHVAAAGALTLLLAGAESVFWSMAALSSVVLLRRARALLLSVDGPRLVRPCPYASEAGVPRYVLTATRTAPRRGPPLLSSI